MSTKHIRTIHAFSRHGRDIEVTCHCGHKAVLSYVAMGRFSRENWSIGLDTAASHFRCSTRGSSPAFIGPKER